MVSGGQIQWDIKANTLWQSKQYLSWGSADNGVYLQLLVRTSRTDHIIAHPIDIFSLAVTDKHLLSASGASSLKVHSTTEADFPLVQSLDDAHKVGCHHIVTDTKGTRAVSAGYAGDLKVWSCQDGHWSADHAVSGQSTGLPLGRAANKSTAHLTGKDVWAISLSGDGQYLAGVSQDGHIKVWDLGADGTEIRDHETKGSFGTCIELVGWRFSVFEDFL